VDSWLPCCLCGQRVPERPSLRTLLSTSAMGPRSLHSMAIRELGRGGVTPSGCHLPRPSSKPRPSSNCPEPGSRFKRPVIGMPADTRGTREIPEVPLFDPLLVSLSSIFPRLPQALPEKKFPDFCSATSSCLLGSMRSSTHDLPADDSQGRTPPRSGIPSWFSRQRRDHCKRLSIRYKAAPCMSQIGEP
jgi:hypothetical protein